MIIKLLLLVMDDDNDDDDDDDDRYDAYLAKMSRTLTSMMIIIVVL